MGRSFRATVFTGVRDAGWREKERVRDRWWRRRRREETGAEDEARSHGLTGE